MDTKVKIAVAGAGRWGINHVRTLQKMDLLGVVIEPDAKRAAEIKKEFNVPTLPDLNAITDPTIKGIVIATPVATHYEIAKKALQQGLGVLIEKPTTTSVAQTQELIVLAQKSKLGFMTGFLLLYSPAIQKIKDLLIKEAIGTPLSFSFIRVNTGTARSFENAWWSLGVHDVAVSCFLNSSEVSTVSYSGHNQLEVTGKIEDEVRVEIGFKNESKANFVCSWNWPIKRRELMIAGTKGFLHFEEDSSQLTWHKKLFNSKLQIEESGKEVFKFDQVQPLALELQEFHNVLQGNLESRAGAEISLRVAEIFERTSTGSRI